MKKRLRLRPFVLPTIYLILVVGLLTLTTLNYSGEATNNEDLTYVSGAIFDISIPVIGTDEAKILKPFTSTKVTVEKSFYDYKAKDKDQENSIFYYEDTYMQNSGIGFTADEEFDVIAILDGSVIKVVDNELLGKTVEIRHDSNLISIYHCLSEVQVLEGDFVTQNHIIGKSGTSKIYNNKPNKLYFELIHNGKHVNPENLFDKTLKEL